MTQTPRRGFIVDYLDHSIDGLLAGFEQETFFIEDPNGNILEMKTMVNPEMLFEPSDEPCGSLLIDLRFESALVGLRQG